MSKQAFAKLCDKLRTEESVYLIDNVEAIWQYFQRSFLQEAIKTVECQLCSDDFLVIGDRCICLKCLRIHKSCQREFPRERFESLLEDFKHDLLAPESKGHPSLKSGAVSYYADKAKRLWNGVKAKIPNVCPTNWVAPKVLTSSEKPACSTCGGSKQKREVIAYLDDVPQYAFKTCPDCTDMCLKCGFWVNSSVATDSQRDCKHRFVDQRKGQRRKLEAERRDRWNPPPDRRRKG